MPETSCHTKQTVANRKSFAGFLTAAAKTIAITATLSVPFAANAATIATGETKTIDGLVKQDRWSKQFSTLVFTSAAGDAAPGAFLVNRFDVVDNDLGEVTRFDGDGDAHNRLVLNNGKAGVLKLATGAAFDVMRNQALHSAYDVATARGGWLQLGDGAAFAFQGVPSVGLAQLGKTASRNTNVSLQGEAKAVISSAIVRDVTFAFGGAIYSTGTVSFSEVSSVRIHDSISNASSGDDAQASGGAIFSKNGALDFSNINTLAIVENFAQTAASIAVAAGGAIYAKDSAVSFADIKDLSTAVGIAEATGSKVAESLGGAIFASSSSVSFERIDSLSFGTSSGTADTYTSAPTGTASAPVASKAVAIGGAIFAEKNATLAFQGINRLAFASVFSAAISRADGTSSGTWEGISSGLSKAAGGAIAIDGASLALSADYLSFQGNCVLAGAQTNATDAARAVVEASALGGAIFLKDAVGLTTVNVGVDGNFAGNYAEAYTQDNIGRASALGGAVYTENSDLAFVTGHGLAFVSNYAKVRDVDSSNAESAVAAGGAIYVRNTNVVFEGAGDLSFAGNSATNVDANMVDFAALGGAIAIENGSLTFATEGNLFFTGNSATAAGGLAQGGAIYVKDGTLLLGISSGKSAVFSGNAANGVNNSIHLEGNSFFSLNNNGFVSIHGLTANANEFSTVSIAQTGAGVWLLQGQNTFVSLADINSTGSVDFSVKSGTLTLDTRATIEFDGPGLNTFTLDKDAILYSRGDNFITVDDTLTSSNAPGGITLKTGSTLAFDIAAAARAGTANLLSLSTSDVAKLVVERGVILNLVSLDANVQLGSPVDYTLVSGGDFSAIAGNRVYMRGEDIVNTRLANHLILTVNATGASVRQTAFENAVITWDSTNSTADWNILATNWNGLNTDAAASGAPGSVNQFLHGDVVNFANAGGATQTITVNAGGVYAAGLYFSGDSSYAFEGGEINTHIGNQDSIFDLASSGSAAATGKLILGAKAVAPDVSVIPTPSASDYLLEESEFSGVVDLSQSGANSFDGVELRSGTLRIASLANISGSFGVTFDSANDAAAPATLALASSIKVNGGDADAQRIVLDADKSGRILLESGVTLEVIGSENGSNGGWFKSGSRSVFTIEGQGNNTLRFFHNHAHDSANVSGGVFHAYNSALNIKGVATITFDSNSVNVTSGITASAFGGAIYAAELSIATAQSLVFSDNVAVGVEEGHGGAVYLNKSGLFDAITDVSFHKNKAVADYAGGGALGSSAEETKFSNIATLSFNENSAIGTLGGGGAIGADNVTGRLVFEKIGALSFSKNYAGVDPSVLGGSSSGHGGAIYSTVQTLAFSDISGSLTFSQNVVQGSGGAIYSGGKNLFFEHIASLVFDTNEAVTSDTAFGGAIVSGVGGKVLFSELPTVTFHGNRAEAVEAASGGAIYTNRNGTIHFDKIERLEFEANLASVTKAGASAIGSGVYGGITTAGGAISAEPTDALTFTDITTSLSFVGNRAVSTAIAETGNASAESLAGAVAAADVRFENVKALTFDSNVSEASSVTQKGTAVESALSIALAGAFDSENARFADIETLEFTNNSATAIADGGLGSIARTTANAGAVGLARYPFSSGGELSFVAERIGSLTFDGNSAIAAATANPAVTVPTLVASASAQGGAFGAQGDAANGVDVTIRFAEIETLTFHGNKASASAVEPVRNTNSSLLADASGGAIALEKTVVDFSNIGTLAFSNNEAASSIDARGDKSATNTAAYAKGGAIVSSGSSLLFENIDSLVFADNTVSATSKYRQPSGLAFEAKGGAIFVTATTLILDTKGDITFSGNKTVGGSLAQGGAIYAAGSYVELNIAKDKTVLFTGNTVQEGTHSATSSSIHFDGVNTFNIVSNGLLDMRDPMSGDGSNSIVHEGTGTWKLGGSNEFSAASIAVDGGKLHLYREGEVTNAGSPVEAGGLHLGTGKFSLDKGAVLSVGGGNEISAQAITLKKGSTLVFQYGYHDITDASKGLLALTTDNLTAAGININIVGGTLPKEGESFTLVSVAAANGAFDTTGKLTLDGANSARDRRVTAVKLTVDSSTGDLQLEGVAKANTSLIWTGEENSEWSDLTTAESPHNWRNKVNSEATITQFLNGDGVLFTDAATNKEVRIGAVGVNVTSFVVETDAIGNDSYFFIGGPIGGETSFVKRGLGDVAFASANTFTGGTAIEDGIVTLFAADALGTGDVANKGVLDLAYSGAFQNNVAGSGYIYVRQAASITFDGNIRNTTLWNDGVTRLNEVRVVSATEEVQSYLGIKADGLLEALGLPPPSPDGPALIEIVLNGVGKPVAVNNELERGVTHRFGDVINNGLIDFVHGGYTLEVASLSTSAGKTGTVRMDIDLLQKNNSDKLVVAGAIKGRHNILMTDASADPNAIRRDSGRGLIVVQAGDISQADVSGKLIAGAYTFSLAANGSNGYTLATASGYSPAASTAIALSASIAPAWFSQLDSLNKRLGDLRLGKAAKSEETDGKKKNDTGTTASQPDNDLWLRAHGQRINSDLGVAGVSNFAEYQYGGDVGVDHEFKFDKSSLFLGAFAGYQHANRSFRDGFGSTSDTDVLAGGLYATWLTSCGFFIDGVVKGQFSETAYRAFSTEADYDNTGLGASLEFGKQFTFGKKDRWFVEPTLQFDYLHVFAETYSTNDGLRVKNGDSDIFRLAGHLRLGRTFAFSPENRFQPYVRLGIENQFSYGGSVRIADSKVEANTDGARFNMGLGAAWQFNQSMQVHFDYEASFGDKYDRPWGFNAGFRYRF